MSRDNARVFTPASLNPERWDRATKIDPNYPGRCMVVYCTAKPEYLLHTKSWLTGSGRPTRRLLCGNHAAELHPNLQPEGLLNGEA